MPEYKLIFVSFVSLLAAAKAERYDDQSKWAVEYKAPRSNINLVLKSFYITILLWAI